ncbi:MAG: hypothetical protein OZ916_09325, partial [Nitrosomonas sp.]|nr:hypothetical protein [Nitrosomonas sp.]
AYLFHSGYLNQGTVDTLKKHFLSDKAEIGTEEASTAQEIPSASPAEEIADGQKTEADKPPQPAAKEGMENESVASPEPVSTVVPAPKPVSVPASH